MLSARELIFELGHLLLGAVQYGAKFVRDPQICSAAVDFRATLQLRAKRLELPSRDEFLKFVGEIRTAGARQSKDCANLVKFLAYSGVRIGEARYVTWSDANFERHQIHVRGDPVTATKNGETRYVPMIPELEQMLSELRRERAAEPASSTYRQVGRS